MSGIRHPDGRIDVTCWTMAGQELTACISALDNAREDPDTARAVARALGHTLPVAGGPNVNPVRREIVYDVATAILDGRCAARDVLSQETLDLLAAGVSELLILRSLA